MGLVCQSSKNKLNNATNNLTISRFHILESVKNKKNLC